MRAPSNNSITLAFGAYGEAGYTQDHPHLGTDFYYAPDDKIYAPFSGKVTQVPNNGNDGNGSYMTDSQGRFHGMLHASSYLVSNGASVNEGQAIAVMGETGFAFGVHCHWAVKENGKFINPMNLVKQEEEQDMMDAELLNMLIHDYFGREPAPSDNIYLGQDIKKMVRHFQLLPEHQAYLDSLKNQNSNIKLTPLAPGAYQVK